ncbi:MAG: short-chain dehydrogenase [Acidobacteria bacterium]|nr:MAG: short-chain dehydrogenase [Acidobacteriota bacterium]
MGLLSTAWIDRTVCSRLPAGCRFQSRAVRGRQESRHGLRTFRQDRTRHRRQPWHRRSHRGRARRRRPLVARHGSRVTPLQLDVTNAAQIAAAAATASDVDLLVNNAGIVGFFGGEFTDPKWIEGGRQEMEVNFLGTFAVTQAFAPVLAKNGGGAIANLNSVASFVSFPILAAYSASKAATHSLTQVTRAMLRGQNTQVFGVYPGPIDTKMGEVLTLEKASPADAARAIVAGIIAGNEEIFPDKMSQGTGPAFFADPKGLERQVAGVQAVA